MLSHRYLSFIIWSYLLLCSISSTTLPDVYSSPKINLAGKINLAHNASLQNPAGTSYTSMDATDFYVSRLTNEGKLEIFDITSKQLKFNLFASTGYPDSKQVISYDLSDKSNNSLTVILNDTDAHLYQLFENGTLNKQIATGPTGSTSNIRLSTQIIQEEFVLITYLQGKTIINRRPKSTQWQFASRFRPQLRTRAFNSKICKANPNDSFYRLAIWKRNCYFTVIQCPSPFENCSELYSENNTACVYSTEYNSPDRDYFKLDWNAECTKIMFESKNVGLKIVDVVSNQTLYNLNATYQSAELNNFWFMDSYDKFVGLYWTNGRFEIYDLSPQIVKTYEALLDASAATAYSRSKKTLYVTQGQSLFQYSFGCNETDFQLQATGICVPIPLNSTSNNTYNDTSNVTSNITSDSGSNASNTVSNETLNTTPNRYINSSTNDTKSKANSTSMEPQNNDNSNTLLSALNGIDLSFNFIGKAGSASIVLFKLLPLSFLVMRYINFWSICSLYLIPNIFYPSYLKSILEQIYQIINVSIFKQFGLNIEIETKIDEKFTGKDLSFLGFSSNFFNSNSENFIMFAVSTQILGFLYFLSLVLPTKNPLRKKLLSLDYKIIILSQFVSITPGFFFNLPIIIQKSYQESFIEKINLAFHNFALIFSAFVSCLILFMLNVTSKSKREKLVKKRERLDCLYDFQCNVMLPMVSIIRHVPLFLAFNSVFFCIPIYTSLKGTSCRLNAFVKSLYLFTFNMGIIIMEIIKDQRDRQALNLMGLIVTLIIFLGSIHEMLEFFINIIIQFVTLVCAKKRVGNFKERMCAQIMIKNPSEDKLHSINQKTAEVDKKIKIRKRISMHEQCGQIKVEDDFVELEQVNKPKNVFEGQCRLISLIKKRKHNKFRFQKNNIKYKREIQNDSKEESIPTKIKRLKVSFYSNKVKGINIMPAL